MAPPESVHSVKSASYREFWPRYLREHRQPANRALHYLGTLLGVVLLLIAVVLGSLWHAAAAVVCGYAFAWAGHSFIERNKPATFTHPLWSLISDFRMLGFWASGRLNEELERHGLGW